MDHSDGNSRLNTALISNIHDAPGKLAVACTGGGSSAIAQLLAVPGASRTVIEAVVPYHEASLAAYIGGRPDQACSGQTARALAMAAFQRAMRFEPGGEPVLGVGCTAALATDRSRRGADRCYVAVQSIERTIEYALTLSRSDRDRAGQEAVCSELVLTGIAGALGLDAQTPGLLDGETLAERSVQAEPEWRALFTGEARVILRGDARPGVVFPGAFNPLHSGHRKMARLAEEITGLPVLLEISAFNVDKPPLDYLEMQARQQGLAGEFDFTFSNAPSFVDKSALFPGAIFIVGSDTLERIASPRYYHDSEELRDKAIEHIRNREVTFMVFGRMANGRFRGLTQIDVPENLRRISIDVPEERFRDDISSTHIRRDQRRG